MKHLKTVEIKTFPTHTYTSFFRVFLFSKRVLRVSPLILSSLVDYENEFAGTRQTLSVESNPAQKASAGSPVYLDLRSSGKSMWMF